ncbi:MAG TPA: DinB family protein [Parasulfuritortus sp.]
MYSWKNYFVVQADYQNWANNVLFESLSHLKPETLTRDEGLFFGSIHHTVDHILAVSQVWLARLQGNSLQVNFREIQHPVWRELQNAMRHETRHLQDWLESQPEAFFEDEIRFRSGDGKEWTMWVRDVLSHLFDHYIHHRGQISAVATRLGAPCPEMDYFYYRRVMEKLLDETSHSPR